MEVKTSFQSWNINSIRMYSIILGLVFVISGGGKVLDLHGFTELLNDYHVPFALFLAPLLSLFELWVGLMLLLNLNSRLWAKVSSFLFIVFTGVYLYGILFLEVKNCGCFGTMLSVDLSSEFVLLRNLILLALSFYVWKWGDAKVNWTNWKKITIYSFSAVALFISGNSIQIQPPRYAEKHHFQSKDIEDTPLSHYIQTHPDSTYLVFLFSYACNACKESIQNLNQYARNGIADKVIGLGLEHRKDVKKDFIQKHQPNFPIQNLKSKSFWEMTDKLPIAFWISGNKIQKIAIGRLYSARTFKAQYLTSN